jgi:aryl-alcohol dehydrogenase-like predicted oxidoreductase
MKTRVLGKTGRQVSEIGFGGWGIGAAWWGPTQDADSLDALRAAWDAGVTFFDTAYVYGDGHSEQLMAAALKGKDAFIATKIPPKNQKWPADPATPASASFPPDWIVSCTERSLQNLRRETLDLTQFHVWADAWIDDDGWKESIASLKRQGKIGAFGVSLNNHEPESALKLVASGLVDTVQVIYNIFDQTPERSLFPACEANGVGVIVRVPFDEGGLTGALTRETTFPEGDFRRGYFAGERLTQTVERASRLQDLLGQEAGTLPELALRFCLRHPAVSTVIPGMRRSAHVRANAGASDGRALSDDLMQSLRAHAWPRNFYGWWPD